MLSFSLVAEALAGLIYHRNSGENSTLHCIDGRGIGEIWDPPRGTEYRMDNRGPQSLFGVTRVGVAPLTSSPGRNVLHAWDSGSPETNYMLSQIRAIGSGPITTSLVSGSAHQLGCNSMEAHDPAQSCAGG